MHRILVIALLFICCTVDVFGQTYYEQVHAATELYHQRQYKASLSFWEKAFSIQQGFSSDYYNAACSFALAGNFKEAINCLNKAISTGWTDTTMLKNDEDFSSLHKLEEWNKFLNRLPEMTESYLRSINAEMKGRLEELRMQDQTIRLLLPDAEKKFGRDSYNYHWFRNVLMPREDSVVLAQVLEIIEENGWLGISEVGEAANQALWLIIQHAPLDIQEKYLANLAQSVEEGESKAWYLAFLEDRILMRKGEKQKYGTQSVWDPVRKKNYIYSIENYQTVNERRVKVGLEPIEEAAERDGSVYDIQRMQE